MTKNNQSPFGNMLGEIPTFDASDVEGVMTEIEKGRFGGSRDRPWDGQRHQWTGLRGVTVLPRMNYRDLGDTIVTALKHFPDLERVDLDALAQTILLAVEEGAAKRQEPCPDCSRLPMYCSIHGK